jgi:hypothetical protein
MATAMEFASRHLLAIGIVMVSVFAASGVLLFAVPEYQPRYESRMIDFSQRDYYSPSRVRGVFAAHGVRLVPTAGESGFVTYYRPGSRGDATALQVSIAPPHGQGSWGPELQRYDERFGNVLVTYGGSDAALLTRVEAAVSSIRNDS